MAHVGSIIGSFLDPSGTLAGLNLDPPGTIAVPLRIAPKNWSLSIGQILLGQHSLWIKGGFLKDPPAILGILAQPGAQLVPVWDP